MAESEGITGYGSSLSYGDTANGTFTAIAEVGDINGPNIAGGDVEFTNNDSPDGFDEFKPNIVDPGEISAAINYTPTATTSLYGLLRTLKYWEVKYPDNSTWVCHGYLKEIQPKAPVKDKLSADITIKLTGKPTWTEGSAS